MDFIIYLAGVINGLDDVNLQIPVQSVWICRSQVLPCFSRRQLCCVVVRFNQKCQSSHAFFCTGFKAEQLENGPQISINATKRFGLSLNKWKPRAELFGPHLQQNLGESTNYKEKLNQRHALYSLLKLSKSPQALGDGYWCVPKSAATAQHSDVLVVRRLVLVDRTLAPSFFSSRAEPQWSTLFSSLTPFVSCLKQQFCRNCTSKTQKWLHSLPFVLPARRKICFYFFLLNVNSQLCARGLDEGRSACIVSIYFATNLQFAKVRFLLFKFLPLLFHITLVALSWVNWFGVLNNNNNNNNNLNSTPLWMATIRNCVDLGVYGLFLETKALAEHTNNRYQISDQ